MKIGLLQSNDICYNSLNYFMESIEKALNGMGIETDRISEFNDAVLNQRYDAMIAINNNVVSVKLEDGSFLLDFFQCSVFLILVDPPYYHHSKLEEHMENLHVIVLDQGHVEYCNQYYPSLKNVQFGYMLGPQCEGKPYEEKEIDILFTGSLTNVTDIRRQAIEFIGEDWAALVFDALVQEGIQHPNVPTVDSMKKVLVQNGVQYTDKDYKLLMNILGTYSEYYLRGYFREKIIQELVQAGLRVHVVGNGWDRLASEGLENLVIMPSVDFAKTADLMANAKMVLNVMPWFKAGLHDRIATTMHNGSICVTDSSTYIEEHFKDNEELIIFNLEEYEKLPERIQHLLNCPKEAARIALNGYRKASEEYSWKNMVQKCILEKNNSKL